MQSRSAEIGIEQQARLDSKLRRELGESVLEAIADERTEDICLNPDGRLWIKRMSEQFICLGTMLPVHALSAMGTIAAQRGTASSLCARSPPHRADLAASYSSRCRA